MAIRRVIRLAEESDRRKDMEVVGGGVGHRQGLEVAMVIVVQMVLLAAGQGHT